MRLSNASRRKPNLASEVGDTWDEHFMRPMLDPDIIEQSLLVQRSARASEDHCMRILGFLAWPDGTVSPGTEVAKREARARLLQLTNKYRVA